MGIVAENGVMIGIMIKFAQMFFNSVSTGGTVEGSQSEKAIPQNEGLKRIEVEGRKEVENGITEYAFQIAVENRVIGRKDNAARIVKVELHSVDRFNRKKHR